MDVRQTPRTLCLSRPTTAFDAKLLGKDRVARLRVKVTGAQSEIVLPPMPAAPKAVKFNDFEGVLADVKVVDWKK